jgi:Serine/threonine protein kinase
MSDFEVLDVISTKGKKNNIRILKARYSSTQETVCLKTFKSHKFSVVQEALHEAKILMSASLHHQNICQMHDCFIEQIQEYFRFGIVMQHFDLGDLEDEIKRRKRFHRPWSEDELFKIFSGLIDALSVLQKNKICHRDLKPQNIFMQNQNHFKIGDFGLSKKETIGKRSLSKTLVGTPIYFSPLCAKAYLQYELCGGDIRVKHDMYKSDVFSLGLTFLRMASLSSIRGLNCSNSDVIKAKISDLGYGDNLRGLIFQMLQLDELRRPDFVALKIVQNEINSALLTIQPDFICSEIFEEFDDVLENAKKELNEFENKKEIEKSLKVNREMWELDTVESMDEKDYAEFAEIKMFEEENFDLFKVSTKTITASGSFGGYGPDIAGDEEGWVKPMSQDSHLESELYTNEDCKAMLGYKMQGVLNTRISKS